jgi:hypothetical protein
MQTPLTRILLAVLAVLGIAPGAWAAFAPESFYTDFPGFRSAWVSGDGPYNEHLIRDVGGFFLALGLLALVAAISGKSLAAKLAGVAWLVFSLVHAWYHLRHLQVYPEPIDQWLNAIGMIGSIALSLAVVILPGRRTLANS